MSWTASDIFGRLNKYHPKIKLASKLNPKEFLDKKLIRVNSVFNFDQEKVNQIANHLVVLKPKSYKHKAIIGYLHGSNKILTNFSEIVKVKRFTSRLLIKFCG